jgi:UDP-3-O-[3-hydroxymyristoyl] N-acetylglucosamine deacetylase
MSKLPASQVVLLEGVGLHSGRAVRVMLHASEGPVVVRAGGQEAKVGALTAISTQWATTVEAHGGAFRIRMVEHAFAALAGLGVRSGIALEVEGAEMPLLDGGAAAWCAALDQLRPPASPPRLRVARPGIIDVGASRYEFSPGPRVDVRVRFETDDVRLAGDACWAGDPDDFRARIAPARTFALAHDLAEIERLGLARHVDPAAVVVVTPHAIHCQGAFEADEPARHKLLDLVGDLYLYGGPPRGSVTARRPGHTATFHAVARAIREGILADS